MSALIRQQLKTIMARVTRLRNESNVLLAAEPHVLASLLSKSEQVDRCMVDLQARIDRWTEILTGMDDEAREAEEAVLENFRVADRTPADDMETLEQIKADIDAAVALLNIAANNNHNGLPPIVNPPPNDNGAPVAAHHHSPHLPTLGLLTFDGNNANWASFMQNFADNIGNNRSLSDAQKLAYLIGQLRGSARAMTDGYHVINENYQPVLDALKSRYGDDRRLASELQSQLMRLPSA